jgi:hypothetical protein
MKKNRFVVILEEPGRIVVYGTYKNLEEAESVVDSAIIYAGALDKLIDSGCRWSPIYDCKGPLV